MKSIEGFEDVKMFRPGYAIEYDFFQPTQLYSNLETKLVKGLFFAGQINGTTGYEEAACQGMMAGINANRFCKEEEPFVLGRSEAYIGVLIDDLVNKGTKEPYRMFTSRAEYRILLRQDNADLRLTPLAVKLGMKNMEERMARVDEKQKGLEAIKKFYKKNSVTPDVVKGYLESVNSMPLKQKVKLHSLLVRPHISLDGLETVVPGLKDFHDQHDRETLELAEINLKYEGYIQKEQDMVNKLSRLESVALKADFDYNGLSGLSSEAREKLTEIKPRSIGQASRISGVSPADISVLLIYMGR